MDIEDQVCEGSVQIGDTAQSISTVSHEVLGTSPVGTGEKDVIRSRSAGTDSTDSALQSSGPGVDVRDVMRLIHESENDFGLVRVFRRETSPKASELAGVDTSLPDNATIVPSVVVDVDNTVGSDAKTGLDEFVIFAKGCGVELSEYSLVQVLPANGQTEGVEAVFAFEEGHLANAVGTTILRERWVSTLGWVNAASSVDTASKVEAGNVHSHQCKR